MTTNISLRQLHPLAIAEEIKKNIPSVLHNIVLEYLTGSDLERFVQFEGMCLSLDKHFFSIQLSKNIHNEHNLLQVIANFLSRVKDPELSTFLNQDLSLVFECAKNSRSPLPPSLARSMDLIYAKGYFESLKSFFIRELIKNEPILSALKTFIEDQSFSEDSNKYFQFIFKSCERKKMLDEISRKEEHSELFKKALEHDDFTTSCDVLSTIPHDEVRASLLKDLLDYFSKSDRIELSLIYAVMCKLPALISELLGQEGITTSIIKSLKKLGSRHLGEKAKKYTYINLNSFYAGYALLEACRQGQKDSVNKLLKAGVNPNHVNIKKTTPLHALLSEGNSIPEKTTNSILEMLIQANANIDFEDERKITPLVLATITGRESTIKILQNAGAIWKANSRGVTPLIFTVANNSLPGIKLLIKSKAQINEQHSPYDYTALMEAALVGSSSEIVNELIQSKADINVRNKQLHTALTIAAIHGHTEIVQLLLENKANIHLKEEHALEAALQNNHSECVRTLAKFLPKDKENDIRLQSYLFKAAIQQDPGMLKVLIEFPIDINQQNEAGATLLMEAAKFGSGQNLETLIHAKAEINAINKKDANFTALIYAALNGHEKETEYLLSQGANKEIQSPLRRTVLGQVCTLENDNLNRIISILILARANVNHADCSGHTPLIFAINNPKQSYVSNLIKANADVNVIDHAGNNPLVTAVVRNKLEIVTELTHAKATLDYALPAFQQTAIMIAAQEGFRSIVSHLIDAKADLNLTNKFGWSALDQAAPQGKTAVARLLVESNPKITPNQLFKAANLAEMMDQKETAAELREIMESRTKIEKNN